MMNLVEATSLISGLHTNYCVLVTFGLPCLRMPNNMSGDVIAVNEWASLIKTNEMPLCPQVMIEPFEKWAIDFTGPINPTSLSKKHILVCTDFVTQWVEAKAVSFATEKVVVDFLFSKIFTRFSVSREIVSENG